MAEGVGFEPTVRGLTRTHDFQSCPFGRSGTPPFQKHFNGPFSLPQDLLAEGEGFEPPEGQRPSAAFEAAPFDHSGTPPTFWP